MTETSAIEVNYPDPDLKGFKVNLQYMSRDRLQKLRKRATTTGFNKTTRQPEDVVDEDLFYKLYVAEALKGWSGLKLSYLKELMPVNLGEIDENSELDFNEENALNLVQNSSDFDTWISAVINDVSLFNKTV